MLGQGASAITLRIKEGRPANAIAIPERAPEIVACITTRYPPQARSCSARAVDMDWLGRLRCTPSGRHEFFRKLLTAKLKLGKPIDPWLQKIVAIGPEERPFMYKEPTP
jgi:hypothetical protein